MVKGATAVGWKERKYLAGKTEVIEEETSALGLHRIFIGHDERGLEEVKGGEM